MSPARWGTSEHRIADATRYPAPVTSGKRTVLVVEDDPAIAQFLQVGLGYEGYDVVMASSGPDALRLADVRAPDLVVLDWMLPGLDGLEVCRRLRGRGDPAILMLTAREAVEDRVAGLEAGADDYLVKPFHFGELLARLRAIERRRGGERSTVTTRADVMLDRGSREVRRADRQVELTPREFDLLRLLMDNANVVLAKDRIVEHVWGYDFAGDTNIVEVYVGYLRDKLADRPPTLIQTVRGVGYVLRDR